MKGPVLVEHPLAWHVFQNFPVSPWKESEVCVELSELSWLPSRHFFPVLRLVLVQMGPNMFSTKDVGFCHGLLEID